MADNGKLSSVFDFLNDQKDRFQSEWFDLLRIASVSARPEHKDDVRKAAEWTRDRLLAAGLTAEVVETAGHPAVIGEGPQQPGRVTVLHYGHYDVQPIGDEKLWTSPAFEPTIRDGAVFARGSADDKGQMLCAVNAAEAWNKAGGGLPINIKFLLEGEEEVGSPNLGPLVEKFAERLACDYVLIHDTSKYNKDLPAITTATKGLIYKEILLNGAKKDLHSGVYGGQVPNPATEVARLLATFHDKRNRVNIPGFYDDVKPLSKDEKKQIAKLKAKDKDFLAEVGAPAVWGETGHTTIERRWARPTFEVNGIFGGYMGPGSMTVLPAKAGAKVSMRLVAGQKAAKIEKAFEKAVKSRCPKHVRLEILSHASCDPYMANLESPGMKAARAAVEQGYGKPPVLIREGGTLPILPMFKRVLGADSLMLGYCLPTCNAHSPDEFFHLSDYVAGGRTTAALFGLL